MQVFSEAQKGNWSEGKTLTHIRIARRTREIVLSETEEPRAKQTEVLAISAKTEQSGAKRSQ